MASTFAYQNSPLSDGRKLNRVAASLAITPLGRSGGEEPSGAAVEDLGVDSVTAMASAASTTTVGSVTSDAAASGSAMDSSFPPLHATNDAARSQPNRRQ